MQSLDPDFLRTFIAVAEAPSFARAGELVHKTQSTVSVQMRRLEEIVGAPLFERHGRRSVLSAEGRRLLDYARRMVRLNDEAILSFRQPNISGRVRIGTPDDYAECFLPAIFARFARSHPQVEVSVECQWSDRLIMMIERGEIDVALVTMQQAMARGRVVRRERLHWVGAPDFSPREGEPLPIAVWQPGCAWRTLLLGALEATELSYRIAYTGANGAALAAAVRSGLAISALPEPLIRADMKRLDDAYGLPPIGSFDIGLVRAQNTHSDPVVSALADHIIASLDNLQLEPVDLRAA